MGSYTEAGLVPFAIFIDEGDYTYDHTLLQTSPPTRQTKEKRESVHKHLPYWISKSWWQFVC